MFNFKYSCVILDYHDLRGGILKLTIPFIYWLIYVFPSQY